MRQAAHIVQVERIGVARLVDARNVVSSKLGGLGQVITGVSLRQPARRTLFCIGGCHGKKHLGGTKFHIVIPNCLRIAIEGNDGEQASGRTGSGADGLRGI